MPDTHRTMRLPRTLWQRYGLAVGDTSRGPDLRNFILWRPRHPDIVLGPDIDVARGAHDFPATIRLDLDDWTLFLEAVGDRDASADLRAYICWRIAHPDQSLPVQSQALLV